MDDEQLRYVTKPTRWTLFLRTFVPWQLWRFAVINLKMIDMARRSHKAQRAHPPAASSRPGR